MRIEHIAIVVLLAACGDSAPPCHDMDADDGEVVESLHMESVVIWGDHGEFEEGGSGEDQFLDPSGIALSPDERELYVYDTRNDRIKVLSRDGETLRMLPFKPHGCGSIGFGTQIAVAPDGTINFVELGTHKMIGMSPTGDIVRSWTMVDGTEPCNHGHPLVVDRDGDIITLEYPRFEVHIYDLDGTLVRRFGSQGVGKGQFEFAPYGVVADAEGLIYLAAGYDRGDREHLVVFDKQGVFRGYVEGGPDLRFTGVSTALVEHDGWIAAFSTSPDYRVFLKPPSERNFTESWLSENGSAPGSVREPFAMAIASDGLWYVSEIYNDRIQVFRPSIPLE